MSLISVKQVTFEYPGKKALDNVSFDIQEGTITALVGPNGAGKTTLMRCIAALDYPAEGDIEVAGHNVFDHPRDVHKHIGYLSDFFGLYDELTVTQCLTCIAWSHQIPDEQIQERLEDVIQRCGLEKYRNTEAGSLSRGWRQRVGIAQTLIHAPKLLILDEPASGVDPEARKSLSELFLQLKEDGMSMLVSSHILSELEDYCTDMLVLRDGKIQQHQASIQQSDLQHVSISITLSEPIESHRNVIEALEGVDVSQATSHQFTLVVNAGATAQHALLKELIKKKLPVCGFNPQRTTLSDVYMAMAHANERETSA